MIIQKENATFLKDIWTEQTGGGCMVDYIEMTNGKILAITDEVVCLHRNMVQADTGEMEDVMYLLEGDKDIKLKPYGRSMKALIALCDGDKKLAAKVIMKLLNDTTIFAIGNLIDKLKP